MPCFLSLCCHARFSSPFISSSILLMLSCRRGDARGCARRRLPRQLSRRFRLRCRHAALRALHAADLRARQRCASARRDAAPPSAMHARSAAAAAATRLTPPCCQRIYADAACRRRKRALSELPLFFMLMRCAFSPAARRAIFISRRFAIVCACFIDRRRCRCRGFAA